MKYQGEENLDVMAFAENYNDSLARLVMKNCPEKEKIIVDFGAGKGLFAQKLKDAGYRRIVCVEPAENQGEGIRQKGLQCVDNLLKIEENSVDFIYALNVLEHIEDDAEMVDLLFSRLREGGKILIYVPAFMCLYSSMDTKVGHWRRYDKKQLENLSGASKWHVKKPAYVDALGFWVAMLFKLLNRGQGEINFKALKFYDRFLFPLSRALDKVGLGHIPGKNICLVADKISRNMCQSEIKKYEKISD